MLSRWGIDCSKWVNITMISSANNPIFDSVLFNSMPVMFWLFFIAIVSGSIARINKKEERGQPWRVPLAKRKRLETILLIATEASDLLYSSPVWGPWVL